MQSDPYTEFMLLYKHFSSEKYKTRASYTNSKEFVPDPILASNLENEFVQLELFGSDSWTRTSNT